MKSLKGGAMAHLCIRVWKELLPNKLEKLQESEAGRGTWWVRFQSQGTKGL